VELFEQLLPRQLEIIYEINTRFLRMARIRYPGDPQILQRISLIEEGTQRRVRMAHLAVVGSHHVNGVAELHSTLLKQHLFADLARIWPERFTNVTNGVTPGRARPGQAASGPAHAPRVGGAGGSHLPVRRAGEAHP
jgi:starch phosphorylase